MSLYEEKFGTTLYNGRLVTDILKRFVINEIESNLSNGFINETVKNGESIEEFSYRVYGTVDYWWIVALVNNIYKKMDWALDDYELEALIDKKYGDRQNETKYIMRNGNIVNKKVRREFTDENGNTIDYFENGDGLGNSRFGIIGSRGVPVSFAEDLEIINEINRNVKIVHKDNIGQFLELYEEI